jgi:predicted Holliday junction resolvase-like endonuclease
MVKLEFQTLIVLLISSIIIMYLLWYIFRIKISLRAKINEARKDTANRQRSTIKGDISETLAPWSMDCVDSVKELRFLGSPIDFVGFKGLDGEGEIDIKFIEIKSGKSRLSKNQRRIRDAIIAGRVGWAEIRTGDTEISLDEKIIE